MFKYFFNWRSLSDFWGMATARLEILMKADRQETSQECGDIATGFLRRWIRRTEGIDVSSRCGDGTHDKFNKCIKVVLHIDDRWTGRDANRGRDCVEARFALWEEDSSASVSAGVV